MRELIEQIAWDYGYWMTLKQSRNQTGDSSDFQSGFDCATLLHLRRLIRRLASRFPKQKRLIGKTIVRGKLAALPDYPLLKRRHL